MTDHKIAGLGPMETTTAAADMADQEIAKLVEEWQKGSEASPRLLHDAVSPIMQKIARGMLRDAHKAEDACQNAWLSAYQQRDQLRDPEKFRAWMRTIVRRECLRILSDRPPLQLKEELLEPSQATKDHVSVIMTEERRRNRLGLLTAAVNELSPDKRITFLLRHWHHMSYEEITVTLGSPLGTVQSQLARALLDVHTFIKNHGGFND